MTASFEYQRGAAIVSWPEPVSVEMRFEALRADRRSGDLTAEAMITSTAPGANGGVLHGGVRVNLKSSRARSELASTLARRTRAEGAIDWPGLVEVAALKVIDAYAQGEPAILLRDAEPLPDVPTLIGPFAPPNDPTLIYGDGESAKSLFALAFELSLESGEPLLGWRPTETRRCAFLDYEWSASPHKARGLAMWKPRLTELPEIVYIPMAAPLEQDLPRVQRFIRNFGIEFLVVDSVALACAGAPEDAQVALGFFQALRQLEVGSLLIAHVNRAGDVDKPFGSAFWHNSARQTWFAKKTAEDPEVRLSLGLFNKKSNGGPRAKPVGFDVLFGHRMVGDRKVLDSIQFQAADVRDVPELAGQVSIKDRLAHALRQGALPMPELAEAVEAPIDTVRRIVDRYDAANPKSRRAMFVKLGGNAIGLAAPESNGHVRTVSVLKGETA